MYPSSSSSGDKPAFLNQALHEFRELRRRSKDPESFLSDAKTADCWVDGLDALRNTSETVAAQYISAVLDRYTAKHAPAIETLPCILSAWDRLLAEVPLASPGHLFPLIAAGIACIRCVGGPPKISKSNGAIVNDTIALLLSPSYRCVRFRAFNEGALLLFVEEQNDSLFRPELGLCALGPPAAFRLRDGTIVTQFYNASHELGHVVFLGDGYVRRFGGQADTAVSLLIAEEALIGMDVLMRQELTRSRVRLHINREFTATDPTQLGANKTLAKRARRSMGAQRTSLALQNALKRTAVQESCFASTLSSLYAPLSASKIEIVNGWMAPAARKKHIDGSWEIATRSHSDSFQMVMSLIPVNAEHLRNIRTSALVEFSLGTLPFQTEQPIRLSAACRTQWRRYHDIRFQAVHIAEIFAQRALQHMRSQTHEQTNALRLVAGVGPHVIAPRSRQVAEQLADIAIAPERAKILRTAAQTLQALSPPCSTMEHLAALLAVH